MSVRPASLPVPWVVADDSGALAGVRRADWRFLLPDPDLGRVAYLAPHDAELTAALTLVSASLDLLDTPLATGSHDAVVVTGGRPGRAGDARALLRRGGWLYAEVPGPRARAWTRALRKAGFAEVAAHWLWPDARGCREIVPLEPQMLRHALGRRDPGARLSVRARAAGLLVTAGVLQLAMRRAAVIGRWP
jgi:hypothetical protein